MQSSLKSANKPLKVGITGGIGSGKSVVSKVFSLLGVPVYNADDRAKWLMANDPGIRSELIKDFGLKTFQGDVLNRKYLAQIVFSDKEKLQRINSIVHPYVGKDFKEWVISHSPKPYILKEAALLYEAGSFKLLDKVIVVNCPEELRIKRVLARDSHRNEEDIKKIIREQMDENEKLKRADYIVNNNENELIIPQVLKLHEIFLNLV